MKVFRRILFLMLILLSSDVYPQYFGYKKPDLRQPKQHSLQVAKHMQKISTTPTARFERRHPHYVTAPSARQKMLALLFATMIINAEIVHSINLISNAPKWVTLHAQKTEASKSAASTATMATPTSGNLSAMYLKPPIIHLVSYTAGQELETFGPCETLYDNSKFCCNIGANATVTSCVHPNSTGFSSCISFDLGGIIGDQSESSFNVTAALFEAEEMCNARPHTRYIANETESLLRLPKPDYLQNFNGTHCTVQTYELSEDSYDANLTRPDGVGPSCKTRLTDISKKRFILPTLQGMINRLARTFNLPRQRIFIYNDETCDPLLRMDAMIFAGTAENSDGSKEKVHSIAIPYASLLKYSDDELADMFWHEVHHLTQVKFEGTTEGVTNIITGNNRELEADIASVLASGNPCLAVWLEKFGSEKECPLLPTLTRENIGKFLKALADGGFIYPSYRKRISMMLHMYEYFRRARALLNATEEK